MIYKYFLKTFPSVGSISVYWVLLQTLKLTQPANTAQLLGDHKKTVLLKKVPKLRTYIENGHTC